MRADALGFHYPCSEGMGDMDVPPKYRERIDALIDGAVIPPDLKPRARKCKLWR